MALIDFFKSADDYVSTINSSNFSIEVYDTETVPSFNDINITYDNLDSKKKKCKRLESCVLYVDIRDSTKISTEKQPKTLARMYSTFVKSMIACARYYKGHVRNIIGDRIMVVFDKEDCFKNSVNTATLMNSVCQYIINKRSNNFDFKAGIGIDFGKMLITKSGALRHGAEKEFYRSLVWLGKPANIASKLTDIANKQQSNRIFSPILMTESVFNGFKNACPDDQSISNSWWDKCDIKVNGYSGAVYGGDVTFTAVEDI